MARVEGNLIAVIVVAVVALLLVVAVALALGATSCALLGTGHSIRHTDLSQRLARQWWPEPSEPVVRDPSSVARTNHHLTRDPR